MDGRPGNTAEGEKKPPAIISRNNNEKSRRDVSVQFAAIVRRSRVIKLKVVFLVGVALAGWRRAI